MSLINHQLTIATCLPADSPIMKCKKPQPPPKPHKESLPPPPPKSKPVMAAQSPVQVVLSPAPAAGARAALPRRHSLDLDQDVYTTVLYPSKLDNSTVSTGDSGINLGEWPVPGMVCMYTIYMYSNCICNKCHIMIHS